MKILQLIQRPQLRGAEMFASQLSNCLLDRGNDVLVVAIFSGDAQLPFLGTLVVMNRGRANRFFDFAGWWHLATIIRQFQPDVIQANAGDTLKFAVFSKFFFRWNVPIVFRNANKVSEFINSWPKKIYNKWLVSQVSHVVSVSEICRQDFLRIYSFKKRRIQTIPIGVDIKPVDVCLPYDMVSVFASSRIIVHVASFVPEKNHAGLIRIAATILSEHSDVKFLLVGGGPLVDRIRNEIAAKGLEDRIIMLGYRKDVFSLLANASFLVLPSLIEGLPGVILEAMYCGTPVIAYDVGGVSEVVIENDTGWLVPHNDEVRFTNALRRALLLGPGELTRIKENARHAIVTDFDNRNLAVRFGRVYLDLLEQKDR